jgi:hypothetical protein
MNKISVIIPYYKNKDELKRCLFHLNKQTVKKISTLIINDDPTDTNNYTKYNSTDPTNIKDGQTPPYYYRKDITGRCIDGAGYLPGVDCSSGYIYIAGKNDIRKYLFSGIDTVSEVDDCSHNLVIDVSYNGISVVDMSNVFVVGTGFITHTVDGGKTWIDISRNTADLTIQNTILRSVWAYDASNAIAVGYKGAIVYTTNGYDWKNAPKQLFDLSGTGYPLIDSSLNNVFSFNKNDFILTTINQPYDSSYVGYGKVIYNHVPDLFNSQNNSVLDVCGNITIAGDIILDRTTSNIRTTGNNLYIASDASNIYIGNGNNENIYLGNSNANSHINVNSITYFNKNIVLNGGFTVNGNIFIPASNYLVSHGIDVSYGTIGVLNINGGTAASRIYSGHDVSYAFHVKGYRPAARIDASLSVNELYVDSSSILFGPIKSTYKSSNGTYATDPALSVTGYSQFGSTIAVDGSNGLITLSSGTDAIANTGNNSYGGLYLSNKTGAFIDGNVYIARNLRIGGVGGVGIPLAVDSGLASFVNASVSGKLTVYGNIDTSSNLTVLGYSHFRNNIDISGNVDISGNLRVTNGNIYGTVNPPSDYRIKTNVQLLSDTSFNIDRLVPKYYYNTLAKNEEIGFIAHEIQEQYPFLVAGVKDGPEIQGVNYTGLIGVLVKEIQDLKARVSQLESYTTTD